MFGNQEFENATETTEIETSGELKNENGIQTTSVQELVIPEKAQGEFERVVQRLKGEKREMNDKYYESGRLAAKKFVKHAPYKDLKYAMEKFAGTEELGEVDVQLVSTDLILSRYFVHAFDNDSYMATDVNTSNEFSRSYLTGWVDLVVSFWNEIKKKI